MDAQGMVAELHMAWWEAVWCGIAWEDNGHPAEFALTIGEAWDKFNRVARILDEDGLDPRLLVAVLGAMGDPPADAGEYVLAAGKARRTCAS